MQRESGLTCPCCGGAGFAPLVDFGEVVQSGTFLESPGRAPLSGLAFAYCTGCAYVRQSTRAPARQDYSQVNRRTERQLPAYCGEIVGSLSGSGIAPSDLVVEVGANDGTFLDRVRGAGFRNVLAVEPSKALCAICAGKGHATEQVHLSTENCGSLVARHGKARAVIFRHTLEHVPDPADVLKAIAQLLAPGGILLLEVPDSDEIFRQLKIYELWDEHVSYFCEGNLRGLLRRAGFAVRRAAACPHLASSNLVAWCALASDVPAEAGVSKSSLDNLASLPKRIERARGAWRAALDGARRPVAVLGAAHPQTNLLQFLGLCDRIDLFVDDDPAKAGKFVPLPTAKAIWTTEQFLARFGSGTLVLSAFGYDGWTRRVREGLAEKPVAYLDPTRLLKTCA